MAGDGHPDHESVGRAAPCHRTYRAALLEYPIWMWHWADPDDDAVPWQRMVEGAADRAANGAETACRHVFRTS
jgi:hypothetical protein